VSLVASRPADEQGVEFLASTDNWFRPVQFANAPDGCLYICDMYREVIEHPWSLPDTIKQHLDLNSGNDRGRIYRIVPERFQQAPPVRLSQMGTAELVQALGQRNGWRRDTAARLLSERQDRSAIEGLRQLLGDSANPLGQLHALGGLGGLGVLTSETVSTALTNRSPAVKRHALRMSESFLRSNSSAIPFAVLSTLAGDADLSVRFQLALTVGLTPPARRLELLDRILTAEISRNERSPVAPLRRGLDDAWLVAAVVQALGDDVIAMFSGKAAALAESFNDGDRRLVETLSTLVGRRNRPQEIGVALALIEGKSKSEESSGLVRDINSALATTNRSTALVIATGLAEGLREAGTSLARVDETGATSNAMAYARAVAGRGSALEAERTTAVRLLGFSEDAASTAKQLIDLVAGDAASGVVVSAELRQTTLRVLSKTTWRGVAEGFLGRWPQLTPVIRSQVIELLLKRTERARALLQAMEQGRVKPVELSPAQQAILREHRDSTIRQTAATLLGQPPTARPGVIESLRPSLELKGVAARGRMTFQARCSSCHKLASIGTAVGPDLVTVKNAGREKLLVNILDPNRELNGNYTSYAVETKDGESLIGLLAGENQAEVTLRLPGGSEIVLRRNQIASIQTQARSLMPEGLEEGLTPQEMADLLEFVLTSDE
jgi:putative heme-binding domain-containing protein